jgi:DNA-binding LacI/PurR family transcriptional regulator
MTQKEIAKRAGVSQATVSLVLNGNSDDRRRIPEQTRERIQKVIAETGYVADPVARRMVKGRNNILGVFTYEPAFPSAQADFFAPFLFGIEEAAQEAGHDLLLMTSAGKGKDGRKRIFGETNRLRLADGCIVLGREFDSEELEKLVQGDFPFVAIGRRDDAGGPVPFVGADYAAATASLVERALELGHTRFAYVGPDEGAESTRDRWTGFQTGICPWFSPHRPASCSSPNWRRPFPFAAPPSPPDSTFRAIYRSWFWAAISGPETRRPNSLPTPFPERKWPARQPSP